MPRIPGVQPKQRPTFREVPQKAVVAFLKGYRRMDGALQLLRALLTANDPWAILRLARIRNWWPIKHDARWGTPSFAHYERHKADYDAMGQEPFIVYESAPSKGLKTNARKVIDPNFPPLGPEDYELGATAAETPPQDSEANRLSDLWPTSPDVREALGLEVREALGPR